MPRAAAYALFGNVAQLPPPPAYNAGWLGNYGFYFLILGAVLRFAALKAVVTAVLRANRSGAYRKEFQNNLEAAMAAAVKQNQPERATASTAFGTAPGGQRMSFGKRA